MKVKIIFEVGLCGFGWNTRQFDIFHKKWSARIALGICAVTFIWEDAAAIREFGANRKEK